MVSSSSSLNRNSLSGTCSSLVALAICIPLRFPSFSLPLGAGVEMMVRLPLLVVRETVMTGGGGTFFESGSGEEEEEEEAAGLLGRLEAGKIGVRSPSFSPGQKH